MMHLKRPILLTTPVVCSCSGRKRRLQLQVWHQVLLDRDALVRSMRNWNARHPEAEVTVLYRETEELRTSCETAVAGVSSGRSSGIMPNPSFSFLSSVVSAGG